MRRQTRRRRKSSTAFSFTACAAENSALVAKGQSHQKIYEPAMKANMTTNGALQEQQSTEFGDAHPREPDGPGAATWADHFFSKACLAQNGSAPNESRVREL